MAIKLSIAIVAYNNYEDIKITLRTLEEYTKTNISKQIFIIDNGVDVSEKKQLNEFLQFISHYKDIKYIDPKKNLGFGKGHNVAIQFIQSEYHAIVNPDIEFIEDAFYELLTYMDKNLDVGMCVPNIINEKGMRQQVYREEVTIFDMFVRMFLKNLFPRRISKHTLQDRDYSKPFQVPFAQGSFLVIRTKLFKELEGFDERYFMYLEDADLCKRVNQISKLMYYPGANIIHKWERGSHKDKTLFKYHINSMYHYFSKWGIKIF